MIHIPQDSLNAAAQRSAEMWAAVRGPGWREGNVTQYLYATRERTGDPEADADLPEGVDAALVVARRSRKLDALIVDDVMEPQEAGQCAELYDSWASGVAYAVDDLVSYSDALYKCRQAHTSQSDWQPDVVLALWLRYRKNADTTLEWVGNEPVLLGWHRTHGGTEYECIQEHVTQSDWTPDAVPALWSAVDEPTSEWTVGVYYAIGDHVTYDGIEYECIQAHTATVGWYPNVVPALWSVV